MAVVILSGAYVKAWFEEVFEVPVYNGMQMMVGDYLRTIFYIDHPEFLKRWASPSRLQDLSHTMLMLK